jgi:dehydrogenase/reductase SDR family member 4
MILGSEKDRKNLIKVAVEKFGKGGIDILVCNAAVSTHFGAFLETKPEAMDKMYEINVKSTYLLI